MKWKRSNGLGFRSGRATGNTAGNVIGTLRGNSRFPKEIAYRRDMDEARKGLIHFQETTPRLARQGGHHAEIHRRNRRHHFSHRFARGYRSARVDFLAPGFSRKGAGSAHVRRAGPQAVVSSVAVMQHARRLCGSCAPDACTAAASFLTVPRDCRRFLLDRLP